MMSNRSIRKNWRDSASLIIIARNSLQSKSFQVLMLKRTSKSSFMPSAYVFPGGVVTSTDFSKYWVNILKNQMQEIQERLNNRVKRNELLLYKDNDGYPLSPEIAFRICSLRETFEECGLLLVRDQKDRALVLSDPDEKIGGEYSTLGLWRDKVNEDPSTFLKLFTSNAVTWSPDIISLYEWSTRLTPSTSKIRFEALFHICFIDEIPSSVEDDGEVVHSLWGTPCEIIDKMDEALPHPQKYELRRLLSYSSFEDLRKFSIARETYGLETFCSTLIKADNGVIWSHPGDDLHDNHPNKEVVQIDKTIEELAARSVHMNRDELHTGSNVSRMTCNVEWCGHPPVEWVGRKWTGSKL